MDRLDNVGSSLQAIPGRGIEPTSHQDAGILQNRKSGGTSWSLLFTGSVLVARIRPSGENRTTSHNIRGGQHSKASRTFPESRLIKPTM